MAMASALVFGIWLLFFDARSHATADICDSQYQHQQEKGNLLLQASSTLSWRGFRTSPSTVAAKNVTGNLSFKMADSGVTEEKLLNIGCEANRGIGKTAAMDENGYLKVVETCCQNEMETFIHRAVAHLGMKVCHEAGPTAFAPYYSCQEGPQSFEALTRDIQRSTVASNASCAWAEIVDVACPSMDYYVHYCPEHLRPMTREERRDQILVSSHRRRSCGLGRSGGPITTGFVEFIIREPADFVTSSDAKHIIASAIAQAASIPPARVYALVRAGHIHVESGRFNATEVGIVGSFAVVDPHGHLDGSTIAKTLKHVDIGKVTRLLRENGADDSALVMRIRVYEPTDPHAPSVVCLPYVPGEPGAPWTPKDIRFVRAKLNQALTIAKGWVPQLESMGNVSWHDIPSSPKLLRLAFHHCMPHTDGTGGCDGCIHWDGVGHRFQRNSLGKMRLPGFNETSNNGLGFTVEFLEEIYTNPDFPPHAPRLEVSLQNCGKSRADLWTLAAIVAVEIGIKNNNLACADPANKKMKTKQQCSRSAAPTCHIDYSRPIAFMTGRRDCVKHLQKPFMSVYQDKQPDPHGNGRKTVEYFKENFGLGPRESVALMGAHTYGRRHFSHSLFRYTWTNRNDKLFSNEYFRNMALKEEWYLKPRGRQGECRQFGDAWGKKPVARWAPHAFGDTVDGTPIMWIQQKLVCTRDCSQVGANSSKCCRDLPAGAKCKPDNMRDRNSIMPEADDHGNAGCEAFRGATGNDEAMINADIGLYYDFETKQGGIPYGCSNLEYFNSTMFRKSHRYRWSGNPSTWGWTAAPQCALNTYADPAGTTPLHQIVEEFANNQQLWIDNFIPAFEKMLGNGYQPGELRINS